MKKVMCVMLLGLLAGMSFAQTGNEPVRDKDLGIMFTFNGLSNLNLGAYDGNHGAVGIGAKMFQDKKAFRATLIFGTGSAKNESSVDGYIGEESSFSGFGIGADYLMHLNDQKITPYMGAGVGFFTGKIKTEEAHIEGGGYSEVEESATEFFVRGIFGLEIFVKKNISLSGEYRLPFTKTTEKVTSESKSATTVPAAASVQGAGATKSESTTKSSSFGISSSAHLTLTIYFNDALF